ncbi:hypothetical protein EV421DRAFT_1734747 [Armillaria borealis]|uniref:Uncharacterized protein n=1 Tax=Armillaria borealis TaxID=47425 RepID=A0AA39JPQ2_9AGAR|nr:hypothetical protein EV421DRAFT_1734747 [Armillaria borealis]
MSSIVLPSRGKCIQVINSVQRCRCLWFFPPESPLLDQNICGLCGHGIHAHIDYVSTVVHHYPANQCAAYVQKTDDDTDLLMGGSDGSVKIFAIKLYQQQKFPLAGGDGKDSDNSNGYSHNANSPLGPNTTSSSSTASANANTDLMSNSPALIFSPGSHRPFSPSDDAGSVNIPITPTLISFPINNASSAIQLDIAQTQVYSSDYFVNSSYAQPNGDATNGGYEYQDYLNAMYGARRQA